LCASNIGSFYDGPQLHVYQCGRKEIIRIGELLQSAIMKLEKYVVSVRGVFRIQFIVCN